MGVEKRTEVTGEQGAVPTADGDSGTATRPEFDITKANQARVYNYLLGGKDHYAADRAVAEDSIKAFPGTVFLARANRAFLGRVVRYLADEAGMRQFLDIGAGIPATGNTHEIAQVAAPDSRVVYVDYDPVVLAHARALLTGATAYIDADLRDTDTLLHQARQALDLTRPVAVMLLSVLHVIPGPDEPFDAVATIMDAMPSGSYLALSHIAAGFLPQQKIDEQADKNRQMSQQQYTPRTPEQLARFFTGMDLVEPGMVLVEQWRPDPGTDQSGVSAMWCAVARKR